jgi:cell division protein FtsB
MSNTGSNSDGIDLSKAFNAATKELIQNLETGVLMGNFEDLPVGILPGGINGTSTAVIAQVLFQQKKKQDEVYVNFILQQTLESVRLRLSLFIEEQEQRMNEMLDQMAQLHEELDELKDQEDALRKELKAFQDDGHFDLDENGRFKNKKADQALREYEKQTGQKIDLTDPESYELVLAILADSIIRQAELKGELELAQEKYEVHRSKRDKAKELMKDLNSDDPEKVNTAITETRNLLKIGTETDLKTENTTPQNTGDGNEAKSFDKNQNGLMEALKDDFLDAFPPLQAEFSGASTGEDQHAVDHNSPDKHPINPGPGLNLVK